MLELIDFVIEEMESKLYLAECDLKQDKWIDQEDKWVCESFIQDMNHRIKKAREWRSQLQNRLF